MAFDRLQRLGDEKFTKIVNLLTRGQPCKSVARSIQQPPPAGWGDMQDVKETALMQQLSRLRQAAAEGAYGAKASKTLLAVAGKPHIDRLAHVSVQVLSRMEELSEAQRTLVLVLLEKATEDKKSSVSTNEAVDNYRKVLLDLQEIRFKLGLDEFKGPVSATLRGASQTTTFPDGMSVQKQIFEAVTTIEQIFDARRIPQSIARDER
jgi:hypothetical protein